MGKLVVTCECLELLALAVWIGGLIVLIAAVIPAVFNSMSMEVGGRMLTRSFHGYDRLVLISGALLILSMLARFWASVPERSVGKDEVSVVLVMIVLVAGLVLYLNPETARLQDLAFSAKDPGVKRIAYDSFFTYHWMARALYLTNMALGILLLCLKVRKWAR